MTSVRVLTFSNVKHIIGKKLFSMEANNIENLLEQLINKYGTPLKQELYDEEGKFRKIYRVLVNGRNIHILNGFQTKLKEEDMVVIMPAIAGGF
jgi:molybdopterin synthase sulfur carrier subunit